MTFTETAARPQTTENVAPSAGLDNSTHPHRHAPHLDWSAEFLEAIAPGETRFTFFTVADAKGTVNPEPARTYHGTLAQHAPALEAANRNGAGVFVAVNETDLQGRKASNIKRIRAAWHDHDKPEAPRPEFPLPPLLQVETSPGKMHSYWPVSGDLAFDEHRGIEDVLAERYGHDPAARDLTRVMRLPGFWHMKNPARPHPVRIVSNLAPMLGGFSGDALRKAFLPNGTPKKPEPAPPSCSAGKELDVDRVKSALCHIDPNPRDTWRDVGMALHFETGGGIEGRELWDEWSQQSDKFDEADQDTAWNSFKLDRSNPITLGTVVALARRNGWQDPADAVGFPPVPDTPASIAVAPSRDFASRFVPLGMSFEDAARIPPRPWIVPNMLERSELSMLVAPGAAGKSLWALHVACAIALGGVSRDGRNPLGVNVKERGRVLFLGYEDRLDDLHRRTTAFCLKHGVDPAMLRANLTGYDVSKGRVLFAEREGRNGRRIGPGYRELVDAIRGGGYDVVVADPLVKFHSLNENDNGEMNFVCDLLRDMALEVKAAVLATHHTGKLKDGPEGIAGDADAGRGASAFRDAVRILLTQTMLDAKTAAANSIPEGDRWRYFRVDAGKINHGPRSGGPSWFCKASVTIPNGEDVPAIVPISFDASPEEIRLQQEVFKFILKRGSDGVPASERGNKNLGILLGKELGTEKTRIEGAADRLRRGGYIERTPRSDRDGTEVWRVVAGQEKWAGEVEVRGG